MQYEGSIVFDAPKESLFELLTDGESLAPCIPGMKTFEVLEPRESFRVVAQAKFGTLEPEMDLRVTFTLLEPPNCARLRIRGRGASSHIGASSYIYLDDAPNGGTEMQWSFTFSVFGQLAGIGHRLMQQAFDRMHQEFIDGVQSLVRERLL
ncbi:MAG: SRPBCC domain-containing protein [Acidobacteriota bacterium]